MHIPDGYLGPATYGGLWAVMVPAWAFASRRVGRHIPASRVPYLAMGTVFSFLAMMFALPLPGGTTGHITGTALVAILLGPWPAVLSVSVALFIQAMVMGDGGVTAIAANCFNIAFVGSLVSSGLYRLLTGAAGLFLRLRSGAAGGPDTVPVSCRMFAGAVASYAAVNAGALLVAVELGLQPLIYAGEAAGVSYFPYPLSVALPAVLLPHLAAVGALEAGITALVLLFLHRTEGSFAALRVLAAIAVGAGLLAPGGATAWAHDYWFESRDASFLLVYGHGDSRSEFDPATLRKIVALDRSGNPVKVDTEPQGKKAVTVRAPKETALLAAELDSGYWSRTIYGIKNLPKRKASRVVESFRSLHYTKALIGWARAAAEPVKGQRLELLPLGNPVELKAGEPLPVRVLYEGRPLADVEIEMNHEKAAITDKEGIARVPLGRGRQLLTVEWKEPLRGDPDADYLAVTATLTLEAPK